MNVHVVAEGKTEEIVLRQLLRGELKAHSERLRILEGGGRSSAQSLARSILGSRREAVALVIDSDVTSAKQVDEQRDFLNWYMSQAGSQQMWHIVLFRPTIESVLFADPAIVRLLLDTDLDESQKVRAEYDPKRVLHDLLRQAGTSETRFWGDFAKMKYNWEALAMKLPDVQLLREFISRHLEPVAA